jgi:hypothetical protein
VTVPRVIDTPVELVRGSIGVVGGERPAGGVGLRHLDEVAVSVHRGSFPLAGRVGIRRAIEHARQHELPLLKNKQVLEAIQP